MLLDFTAIADKIPFILFGALITLKYTILSVLLGFLLGCLLSLARISKNKVLQYFAKFYISIFRGIPLLVQLYIIYYTTPHLFNYNISVFEAGIITLSLNSTAYIAEIMRGGFQSINIGQFEAAHALGLSYNQTMVHIIMPQVLKNVLPALANEFIDLLKESTIIALIGEKDLLGRATLVAAESYRYFEPYFIAAATYYCLIIILSQIISVLENKWQKID